MVTIKIETIGEERFIRGFNRIPGDMADMRPAFQDISLDFYGREKQIFSREGDPKRFEKLTNEKYKAWKRKHYPGKKIMELTGRLRKSLIAEGQAVARDTVKIMKKKEAEFGTQVPYAHRHQMGTVGMPKRMIVQLTEPDKIRWARIIHEWAYNNIVRHVG